MGSHPASLHRVEERRLKAAACSPLVGERSLSPAWEVSQSLKEPRWQTTPGLDSDPHLYKRACRLKRPQPAAAPRATAD